MLISEKQHEANQENAKHSTGPKTPEGKQAVRLNALQYGLSARSIILPFEDPEAYKLLWANLEDEWQPRTFTERLQLEQMANALWFLARIGNGEHSIYLKSIPAEQQLPLMESMGRQRNRFNHQFNTAMHTLEHLQQKRMANRTQSPKLQRVKSEPVNYVPSGPPDLPANAYIMSEAPRATDTR